MRACVRARMRVRVGYDAKDIERSVVVCLGFIVLRLSIIYIHLVDLSAFVLCASRSL